MVDPIKQSKQKKMIRNHLKTLRGYTNRLCRTNVLKFYLKKKIQMGAVNISRKCPFLIFNGHKR